MREVRPRASRGPIATGGATLLTDRAGEAPPGFEIKKGGLGSAGQAVALATLCAVLFLTFLDNTIVSVGLANVQSDLHAGVSQLQWVVNGYALTFASFMLVAGMLGDILGRKRIMLAGVAIFCAGSVVAALASNADWLIAGRVIMGVGAAASEPGTLSIIRHVYPDRETRADALGVWAAVAGLALALGPVVGGALVGFSSWRAIFWFNLGFGLVAFVLALVSVVVLIPNTGATILGMPSAAWVPGVWVDGILIALAILPLALVFSRPWVRQVLAGLGSFEARTQEGLTDLPEVRPADVNQRGEERILDRSR